MVKVKIDKTESTSEMIATRPGIQISNCKKGGVGKTLLSKLKAAYCLESGLDFYGVDADRQESFLKAYPEFALPTRFSELDRNLKIPDRILDLALEKLVLTECFRESAQVGYEVDSSLGRIDTRESEFENYFDWLG